MKVPELNRPANRVENQANSEARTSTAGFSNFCLSYTNSTRDWRTSNVVS